MPLAIGLLLSLALVLSTRGICDCFTPPARHNIAIGKVRVDVLVPTTKLFAAGIGVAATGGFTSGLLVEFYTGTGPSKTATLGAIVGPDGKKNVKILTSSGRTVSVPPRAIRHVVPNGRSISNEAQIEEHELAAAAELERDMAMGGANVAEVWEMLVEDDTKSVELTTLADLIVGDDSSVSCYAARAILTNGVESVCFKEISVKGRLSSGVCLNYEPRPPELVKTLRQRAQIEAAEQANWFELKQRIDEACDSTASSFDIESETQEIQAALVALERLGCLASLSPGEAEEEEKTTLPDEAEALVSAKAFLQKVGRRQTAEAARSLLIGLRIWDIHTNLDLIRLRIPTGFDPELETLAAEIAMRPPPDADKASRLDLTHLPAFAIDESSTEEVDDALSVEILETDGPVHTRQRLWVHIADPSRYVELGSPLDKEARRRATSLYLPTGTVPMFPMSLASGLLSLSPAKDSCALSVGLLLDANGCIDESTPPIISPSLVRITRLTYDQVDRLLDPFAMIDGYDDSDTTEKTEATIECLRRLDWASERRLQWRKDGGSLESIGPYELPDMMAKAWPSPDEPAGWGITILAKERHVASRIVTELMLVANEAIAMYGESNGVPLPFRCQEVEEVTDEEIEATPEGPCRSWLAIRATTRSQVTPNPRPHGGLGLDLYVQATSPVRRYADLALHHQIKAHLRGDPLPFPAHEEGADTMVRLAQNGAAVTRQVERSANDYWLKEFLRRRGGAPTDILVLSSDRYKKDVYKLLLPELGGIITYRSTKYLSIGDKISMPSFVLADF